MCVCNIYIYIYVCVYVIYIITHNSIPSLIPSTVADSGRNLSQECLRGHMWWGTVARFCEPGARLENSNDVNPWPRLWHTMLLSSWQACGGPESWMSAWPKMGMGQKSSTPQNRLYC